MSAWGKVGYWGSAILVGVLVGVMVVRAMAVDERCAYTGGIVADIAMERATPTAIRVSGWACLPALVDVTLSTDEGGGVFSDASVRQRRVGPGPWSVTIGWPSVKPWPELALEARRLVRFAPSVLSTAGASLEVEPPVPAVKDLAKAGRL